MTRQLSTTGIVLEEDRARLIPLSGNHRTVSSASKNSLLGFPEAMQPDTLGSRQHLLSIL